jgi:hypothetical protein
MWDKWDVWDSGKVAEYIPEKNRNMKKRDRKKNKIRKENQP